MGVQIMRSYYSHLETLKKSSSGVIEPRGTFRSSSIFPVFHTSSISSRLLFLGYWMLKRNIPLLSAVVTLRTREGHILVRKQFTIAEAKAYRIELKELLTAGSHPEDCAFTGSMELELFSAVNLVFPFPAVVINYYGPSFSTVVHTAQRVYNDFEDMWSNSQTDVPESGFNIYANREHETFIGLVNGPIARNASEISWQFFNAQGESLTHRTLLQELNPYETFLLHPSQLCPPLKQFLNGQAGSCKVHINIDWIFPRLIVATQQHDPDALTLTHTYYDCSHTANDSDYWLTPQEGWHPATLAVPVAYPGKNITNIYFYPIYSPTRCGIDVEFYDKQGKLLAQTKQCLVIDTTEQKTKVLQLHQLVTDAHLEGTQDLMARMIAYPLDDNRLPSRIKIGFDTGGGTREGAMACNICTNFQPFNPALEQKPSSFRWDPILADQPESKVWIINSSTQKSYEKSALVELTFYREADTITLKKQYQIPPHGFLTVSPQDDAELKDFLKGAIGWLTVTSDTPHILTYYFCRSSAGITGGDHGF